jgi:hypothetical protein
VDTADEAVNIAVKALRSVYGGSWGFDLKQSVKEKSTWIVDIDVLLFGVRRVTIDQITGRIQKIESVT